MSSNTADSPGQHLRTLMSEGPVLAPIVWDAGQARFAAEAEHRAIYMTGLGTAATFGLPDIGLIGLEEMASNVERIAAAVNIPVIADADTGYGNAVNVARTVERYEAARVAALHIEDQVSPKRCGDMAGKAVVPIDEMVQKVRGAVAARQDPGLIIIARTDAFQVLGWDAVVERCRAYRDSGADMVYIDGLHSRADLERAADAFPDIPRMVVTTGFPLEDAETLGYQIVVHWGTLLAIYGATRNVYRELAATGTVEIEARQALSLDELAATMDLARHLALEQAPVNA